MGSTQMCVANHLTVWLGLLCSLQWVKLISCGCMNLWCLQVHSVLFGYGGLLKGGCHRPDGDILMRL